jgi:hypothetical protein
MSYSVVDDAINRMTKCFPTGDVLDISQSVQKLAVQKVIRLALRSGDITQLNNIIDLWNPDSEHGKKRRQDIVTILVTNLTVDIRSEWLTKLLAKEW